MHISCTATGGRRLTDMTRVRLIDHLLTEPSTPLALAERTDEGWEPLHPPPPRGLLASVAEVLFAMFGAAEEWPVRRRRAR